jgi:hypothetical protein
MGRNPSCLIKPHAPSDGVPRAPRVPRSDRGTQPPTRHSTNRDGTGRAPPSDEDGTAVGANR